MAFDRCWFRCIYSILDKVVEISTTEVQFEATSNMRSEMFHYGTHGLLKRKVHKQFFEVASACGKSGDRTALINYLCYLASPSN